MTGENIINEMIQPMPLGDMYKSHAELAREVDIKHKPANYFSTLKTVTEFKIEEDRKKYEEDQ